MSPDADAATPPLPDYSGFYRQNERVAREIARLTEAGTFRPLLDLLSEGDLELEIRSWSPSLKQEEYLGNLTPRRDPAWDFEAVMAERKDAQVRLGDAVVSVYVPDHICPACGNDRSNYIKAAQRHCDACGFIW